MTNLLVLKFLYAEFKACARWFGQCDLKVTCWFLWTHSCHGNCKSNLAMDGDSVPYSRLCSICRTQVVTLWHSSFHSCTPPVPVLRTKKPVWVRPDYNCVIIGLRCRQRVPTYGIRKLRVVAITSKRGFETLRILILWSARVAWMRDCTRVGIQKTQNLTS